jgi:CysZ protein
VRGIRYFFGGAGFVAAQTWLWGFVLIPMLLTSGVLAGLGWLATEWITSSSPVIARQQGKLDFVASWLHREVTPASLTPVLAVSLVVAAVVQPLSAIALDIVTREQVWKAARRVWAGDDASDVPFRSLEATICSLAAALPALVLLSVAAFRYPKAWHVIGLLALVISGLALAWNFLEYPLSQRDLSFSERIRWLRRHFGAVLGFGAACAVVLVLPGVGLIVIPAGVAGATRLMLECDRADRENDREASRAALDGSRSSAV